MADDITAKLVLDLGDLRAQLEGVRRDQAAAADRAEVVERKVVQAKRQVEVLEPQVSAIERKIVASVKSMTRMGLAVAGSAMLEALDVDDGLAGSASRIVSGGLSGLIFSGGNLAVGGAAATAAALSELARGIRDQYKATEDLRKLVTEMQTKANNAVDDLRRDYDARFEATRAELYQEAYESRERLKDLLYETAQYAADHE